MKALETELKTYQKLMPGLLAEQGKFALIAGEELLGVYSAYDDALKAGYSQRGILNPSWSSAFQPKSKSHTSPAIWVSHAKCKFANPATWPDD